MTDTKIRSLTCCCCGDSTHGRQWWNRDTGYGMCVKCIEYVRKRGTTDAEILELYGERGVHWGVDRITPKDALIFEVERSRR